MPRAKLGTVSTVSADVQSRGVSDTFWYAVEARAEYQSLRNVRVEHRSCITSAVATNSASIIDSDVSPPSLTLKLSVAFATKTIHEVIGLLFLWILPQFPLKNAVQAKPSCLYVTATSTGPAR